MTTPKFQDRREYAIGIRKLSNGEPVSERDRKIKVVTGKIDEAPVHSTDEPLRFSDDYRVVPSVGGLITPLPLSAVSEGRFKPEWRLPVTRAVAQNYEKPNGSSSSWVVVRYNGALIACTADEAYERGLREEPNWGPPGAV